MIRAIAAALLVATPALAQSDAPPAPPPPAPPLDATAIQAPPAPPPDATAIQAQPAQGAVADPTCPAGTVRSSGSCVVPEAPPPAHEGQPNPGDERGHGTEMHGVADRGPSPRDASAGPESQQGFHYVDGGRCPEGEHPAKENDTFIINTQGQLGCVPRGKHAFVKGELTNLGSTKLVLKDSRVGIAVGPWFYGNDPLAALQTGVYLHVQPEVDLQFGDLAFGVNLPLNFLAYPGGLFAKPTQYLIRKEDWATPANYARVVSYLTYGHKEDHFYLNISQLFAATIGHGTVMRRYFANTDVNDTHVGAEIDAYNRWAGFQIFTRDIIPFTTVYDHQANGTIDPAANGQSAFMPPLIAGVAFVKPFGAAESYVAHSASFGLTYAADLAAPYALTRQKSCNFTMTPATCADNPQGDLIVQPNGQLSVDQTRAAQIVGLDFETKIYKSDTTDLKPYLDASTLLGGGSGVTLGMLGRFNFGADAVSALRVVLEGRTFDGRYLPSYFDRSYEIQKFQMIERVGGPTLPPKLDYVLNGDATARFVGYHAELSWAAAGGFSTTLAYEDGAPVVQGHPDPTCNCFNADDSRILRDLAFHVEYPVYSWFQFFVTLSKRSFEWSNVGTFDDNTLLYAQARLHLLPILFLNFGAYRTYQVDPTSGAYHNAFGGNFSLEVGYEFDRAKKSDG